MVKKKSACAFSCGVGVCVHLCVYVHVCEDVDVCVCKGDCDAGNLDVYCNVLSSI